MALSIFSSPPTSYANEQLKDHLVHLSTLPVTVTGATDQPSDIVPQDHEFSPFSKDLGKALAELTHSTTPSAKRVATILHDLGKRRTEMGTFTSNRVDTAAEAEIMTRSVSIVWAHVLQVFVDSALALEDDSTWWDRLLAQRSGTTIYLVQSMPERMWRALAGSVENGSWRQIIKTLHWPKPSKLFRPLHGATTLTQQLTALSSPLVLTRREMVSNRNTLGRARDLAASRVGILASQGPSWSVQEVGYTASSTDLMDEAGRVYNVLCDVLNIRPEKAPVSKKQVVSTSRDGKGKRGRQAVESAPKHELTPQGLVDIVQRSMPEVSTVLNNTLEEYGRPSVLTRFWFPFLFLPPALYLGARTLSKNKDWIKEQVRNTKETFKGFFVQWVIEPMEEIVKTMRTGGEGLAFAPKTVQTDEESLKRMVVEFGRDVYKLDPSSLDVLKQQVDRGDMETVLKAYENEIRQPIKSALFGHLIRTLLIQVQKTKTDLSVALLSLDQLLRSQQLTFAFVGVAPSVMLLWGVWGMLGSLYRGESRGRSRRRRYFHSVRAIEALLLQAPQDDARMSDRDRGMLIVTTSGLRVWAVGVRSSSRQAFLDDLRMFENQSLTRDDKLHVVQRVWRCWGRNGRGTNLAYV